MTENETANDIWLQNIEEMIACDMFEDAFNIYHSAVAYGYFGDALFDSGTVEIEVEEKVKQEMKRLFPELDGYEK